MYGHLGLPGAWVPTSRTGRPDRSTSNATSSAPLAIGFGWAIGIATTAMVVGAAVLTAVLTP